MLGLEWLALFFGSGDFRLPKPPAPTTPRLGAALRGRAGRHARCLWPAGARSPAALRRGDMQCGASSNRWHKRIWISHRFPPPCQAAPRCRGGPAAAPCARAAAGGARGAGAAEEAAAGPRGRRAARLEPPQPRQPEPSREESLQKLKKKKSK